MNRLSEIQKAQSENRPVIYAGVDVHKNSYQCHYFNSETGEIISQKIGASSKAVIKQDKKVREQFGQNSYILYGYEAGPTGDKLKRDLDKNGFNCDIIPLQYVTSNRHNQKIKTDKRDAETIAETLQLQKYKPVFVPDETDKSVRDFIRMREDLIQEFKRVKQRIKSMLLRLGLKSPKNTKTWSREYLAWLNGLDLLPMDRETLDQYLHFYQEYSLRIKEVDKKIKKIAQDKKYSGRVNRLRCFKGIDYLIALAVIVEIGDFDRFDKPSRLASYIGLIPREYSSGDKNSRGGITKTGNKFIRKLLILAAQSAVRGNRGIKNSHQLAKQKGNSEQMILYAQRADERIRDKFYRMVLGLNKPRNVAITAVAREMTNFIWGALTDHID